MRSPSGWRPTPTRRRSRSSPPTRSWSGACASTAPRWWAPAPSGAGSAPERPAHAARAAGELVHVALLEEDLDRRRAAGRVALDPAADRRGPAVALVEGL